MRLIKLQNATSINPNYQFLIKYITTSRFYNVDSSWMNFLLKYLNCSSLLNNKTRANIWRETHLRNLKMVVGYSLFARRDWL